MDSVVFFSYWFCKLKDILQLHTPKTDSFFLIFFVFVFRVYGIWNFADVLHFVDIKLMFEWLMIDASVRAFCVYSR